MPYFDDFTYRLVSDGVAWPSQVDVVRMQVTAADRAKSSSDDRARLVDKHRVSNAFTADLSGSVVNQGLHQITPRSSRSPLDRSNSRANFSRSSSSIERSV